MTQITPTQSSKSEPGNLSGKVCLSLVQVHTWEVKMVAPARAVFRPSGFFLRIKNYQKVKMKIASFFQKNEISMKSVDQRQSSFYVLKSEACTFFRILSTHILSHTGYSHIKILSQILWFEHLVKLLIRAKRRW